MKRKILIILLWTTAVVVFLTAGAGLWAYSHGYYHALSGGIAQNNKDFDKALSFFKTAYEKNPQAFMVAHDIACCYALKGDNQACFHWLRPALKSSYGDHAKNYAKTEHDFDSVRQTPEFQSLIYDAQK